MKPTHCIPPALTILGSAYWLLSQNQTITELTEKTTIVEERIVIAREVASTATPASILAPSDPNAPDEYTLPDGSLDWEALGRTIRDDKGGNAMGMPLGMSTMLLVWKKITFLEEDEIPEGLAKIEEIGLNPAVLEFIQEGLIEHYGELNPKAALEAFDEMKSAKTASPWRRQKIFAKLAKEDPVAATNWLDQQISEGKLLSNSLGNRKDPRIELESELLPILLGSDLAAAKARLAKYPEDQTQQILTSVSLGSNKDSAGEFIALARESLPADSVSDAIIRSVGNIRHEELSDVSNSLRDLPITSEEKYPLTEKFVSKFANRSQSKDKYSEIYQWAQTEVPDQSSALVASALANDQRMWSNPESLVREAITLSDSSNDPAILSGFVQKVQLNGNSLDITDPEVLARFNSVAESLKASQPADTK